MKEYKSKIPLPLYNYTIFVIFTDSLVTSADRLVAQGKLTKGHGIDDTVAGFHVRMPNQGYSFIVLKLKSTINAMVHEVYHAVATLMRWIGATHEEELFAYHMGYVMQCVVDDQKKARKRKSLQ